MLVAHKKQKRELRFPFLLKNDFRICCDTNAHAHSNTLAL